MGGQKKPNLVNVVCERPLSILIVLWASFWLPSCNLLLLGAWNTIIFQIIFLRINHCGYVGINWKESFKLNFAWNREIQISCITDYVTGLVLYDVKIDFTISPEQNSCKVISYFVLNFYSLAASFLYPPWAWE